MNTLLSKKKSMGNMKVVKKEKKRRRKVLQRVSSCLYVNSGQEGKINKEEKCEHDKTK